MKSSSIDIDNGKVVFEVRGSGQPLVLIPGFASGAWSWQYQTAYLANDFSVITFDPRGVSRSVLNEGGTISIDLIADDIAKILDHLEIEKAHVLGISFGGFVAQQFVAAYPELVDRLILASTSFGGPDHVAPGAEVLASFASTEGLNSPDRIRRYLTMAFSSDFIRSNGGDVDRFCTLREENVVPESVYQAQLMSAVTFNAKPGIEKVAAKTLVLTGDKDMVVPAENSHNLAAAILNSKLRTIYGGGHMAFVENAAEFNQTIRDFLLEDA